MMNPPHIGPELLQQAGLSSGTLTAQDREVLRQKIERLNTRAKRLKTAALAALALILFCIAVVAIARNGPDRNHGVRLAITYVATIGYLVGIYGGIGALIAMFIHRLSARALEVSSRLANMEVLLASAVFNLDRLAQQIENRSRPPA